jgi:hypothetical protein
MCSPSSGYAGRRPVCLSPNSLPSCPWSAEDEHFRSVYLWGIVFFSTGIRRGSDEVWVVPVIKLGGEIA